jgi:putative phosphotransacetylase
MNSEVASSLGVVDGELVKVIVPGDKACILFAHIKVSDNGVYELHIDFDDANSCGLKNGDEVEIII